jgi:hypothetical protein
MFVALSCAVGCGSDHSPTSPDPRIPPTTGTPTRMQVIDWNFRFDAGMTSARAEARWGDLYSATRDVTTEADWQINSPIVRVAAPGQLVASGVGDAELTVSFRGLAVRNHLRVFAGEPPLLVLEPGSTSYVGAFIRDGAPPAGRGIEGVQVEVIGGHNAGRTAVTDSGGFYRFFPPFTCGPVTARASKAGYRDVVASSIMCMSGMPDLAMVPSQ